MKSRKNKAETVRRKNFPVRIVGRYGQIPDHVIDITARNGLPNAKENLLDKKGMLKAK